jgi:regulation of enolase protein 1 (concanavalin A-like superfamily)
MDYKDFNWINETKYEETEDGIQVYAPADTDYFVNPIDGNVKANAPFFYKEVDGDFILRAKVSHDFISTYDACVLLALENDKLWAKACFEYTDLGTNAVVTVMTNEKSDDANGINIEGNEIWLQMSRKDNVFAIHYSLDGKEFMMSRLSYLPMQKKIKVGLEAQSPTGKGGMRKFTDVSLEIRSPLDIRKGF